MARTYTPYTIFVSTPGYDLLFYHSSGYRQNIEWYIKASNKGKFTACNVNRCKITLEHVGSILTSLRDEKLKVEQLRKQVFNSCSSHS